MNIGFISGHACIRAQKMALGLIKNGHKIYFIANRIPSFSEYYNSVSVYQSIEQLRENIKQIDRFVDVWHVHNEPSYYVSLVKEVSKKPCVLDVHDSHAARITEKQEKEHLKKGEKVCRITSDEVHNFQMADALVYPCVEFMKVVCETYGLEKKENIVLPSYVPSGFFNYEPTRWMDGVVYEGRIDLPDEIKKGGKQGFNYTDYTGFAEDCYEKDVDFYIYATRNDDKFKKAYEKAYVAPGQQYENLIKALSGHAWGLVGNTNQAQEWKVAFPNKLFEYIAAGTPVVSFYADACAEFILSQGIGIVCGSVQELKDRWLEHEECRKNVIKKRHKYAMENKLDELVKLYQNIQK